ncbi:MAG: LexA repressor [Chlamydiae bacterium]|nr:LexA repressor [Chlamydiota bacterium]
MKLQICKAHHIPGLPLPLFSHTVEAGFPSPAEGYLDETIDLNQLLIAHPTATFFVRVMGESMNQAGILPGDVLVVDRSIEPQNRSIVLAVINAEFTVKRLLKKEKKLFLAPENSSFSPIEITSETDFKIWGVITYVIHKAS